MTCYNREKYIGQAIQSVLHSSYSHFELIIVDDASTDETVKIAKKYADEDERIKVYINEKNLGDYPNRNKAASYAKGKYLKYVDSDDYLYPHGLEVMVNCMEQFPQAGFGLCSLKPNIERTFPFVLEPKEAYEYHFFGPGLFHKGPLSAIFLKLAFDAVGGFKEERMISDIDMWYRIALQYSVVLMPDGLVWQRSHPGQELNYKKDYIEKGEKIKWKYLLSLTCPLNNHQIKQIRKIRIKRYVGFILAGLKRGNFQQVKTYWKCLVAINKLDIK